MNGDVGEPLKSEARLEAVDFALRAGMPPAAVEPPIVRGTTPSEAVPPPMEAVIDRETYDGLVAMLSSEMVDSLLVRLRRQIEDGSLPRMAPGDARDLARAAHSLVSAAGLLGFGKLSRLCQGLEATILAGEDETAQREAVAQACREAVCAIDLMVAPRSNDGMARAGTAA